MKKRIVMRLHLEMQELLEREAVWRGPKVGTLTAEILHKQAETAKIQGISNYEMHPLRDIYVPSNSTIEKTAGNQISIFLSDEDMETLQQLTLRPGSNGIRIVNGKRRTTYRYVIPGMLLHAPIFAELTKPHKSKTK